jgi:hypothetical protein
MCDDSAKNMCQGRVNMVTFLYSSGLGISVTISEQSFPVREKSSEPYCFKLFELFLCVLCVLQEQISVPFRKDLKFSSCFASLRRIRRIRTVKFFWLAGKNF